MHCIQSLWLRALGPLFVAATLECAPLSGCAVGMWLRVLLLGKGSGIAWQSVGIAWLGGNLCRNVFAQYDHAHVPTECCGSTMLLLGHLLADSCTYVQDTEHVHMCVGL